ncbi:MAG: M24 family metallopeptidase [Candidatus Lokiarchaeota archaeon]|nr:M24 family metallopeptidase [Candidatus Lokiarchaeota archaeon]
MHDAYTSEEMAADFERVSAIVARYKARIDPSRQIPTDEFVSRQRKVVAGLKERGYIVGFVFSDEHYAGDVPYLAGNINISIEQIAGVIGPTGFHVVAGLEGGYVVEQLAGRSKSIVHKAEMLQLADEKYPIAAEKLESVIEAAAGVPIAQVERIALLTPRQIVPASVVSYLEGLFGRDGVVDEQEVYYKIKYIKSDMELALIRDASLIADAMMRAMLAVVKPGMLETEVASWAYFTSSMLGAEGMGFKVIIGAGEANRTLIGLALNRRINKGDWVHLGVSPKRDGLASCVRRSIIAGVTEAEWTPNQRYWFDFIEAAYHTGFDAYVDVARGKLPARLQEKALVDFFKARSKEASARYNKEIQLEALKPYTGTHNAGYTECQEFYGAITLDSEGPLGEQIVTMLDVALRGIGDRWNDVIIPDLDYIVIENTLGKFGTRVECFNELPLRVQHLVGKGVE